MKKVMKVIMFGLVACSFAVPAVSGEYKSPEQKAAEHGKALWKVSSSQYKINFAFLKVEACSLNKNCKNHEAALKMQTCEQFSYSTGKNYKRNLDFRKEIDLKIEAIIKRSSRTADQVHDMLNEIFKKHMDGYSSVMFAAATQDVFEHSRRFRAMCLDQEFASDFSEIKELLEKM